MRRQIDYLGYSGFSHEELFTTEALVVRKNPQDPHSSSIYRSIFECWARARLLKAKRMRRKENGE
jgi:hypothetical protein